MSRAKEVVQGVNDVELMATEGRAMSEDGILSALARAEIFQGLTPAEVKTFYESSQKVAFKETDIVIAKDQLGAALYVILKGQFEVELPLGVYIPQPIDGQIERRMTKVRLNMLQAGDCFGEYSLIDHQLTSASVTATRDGELLKITKSAFDEILQANEHIAKVVYYNMLQVLVGRLRKQDVSYSQYLLNYGV